MASLNLEKLTTGGKVAFGAFVGVLVFAVFYFLAYSDLGASVKREEASTTELRNNETVKKQDQADYFRDKDELSVRETKEREFNKVLPEEAQIASFLSTLQQISNVAGVDLKAWQPQPEKPESFYARVPMKLEVSGKFHQLAKFMYEMGRTDRIINLENIELDEPTMSGEDVNVKAKCLATTFHLVKQDPAVVAAGGGVAPPAPGPGGK